MKHAATRSTNSIHWQSLYIYDTPKYLFHFRCLRPPIDRYKFAREKFPGTLLAAVADTATQIYEAVSGISL